MKRILFCIAMLCSSINVSAQNKDEVEVPRFDKVEVEAEFPGKLNGWRQYLEKNLKANTPVKNNAPLGQYQVIVRFIVSKTGEISDVQAETAHGFGMEEEVIRIIKKGPSWTPAIQNGKPVNAYRRQPVTFVVQEDGIEINSKMPYQLLSGKENIITIDIAKTDNENLEVTLTNGSIKYLGGNRYKILTTGTGKAILEIFNTKKSRKKIATASFQITPGS